MRLVAASRLDIEGSGDSWVLAGGSPFLVEGDEAARADGAELGGGAPRQLSRERGESALDCVPGVEMSTRLLQCLGKGDVAPQ